MWNNWRSMNPFASINCEIGVSLGFAATPLSQFTEHCCDYDSDGNRLTNDPDISVAGGSGKRRSGIVLADPVFLVNAVIEMTDLMSSTPPTFSHDITWNRRSSGQFKNIRHH